MPLRPSDKTLAWGVGIPVAAVVLFFAAVQIFVLVNVYLLERNEAQVEKGLAHIADTGRPYEPWSQYDLMCFGSPPSIACSTFLAAARKAGHEPIDVSDCCGLDSSNRISAVGYLRAGKFSCDALINPPFTTTEEKLCFPPSRLRVKRAIGNYYSTMKQLKPGEYFQIGEREN
jgi:hypothetical protein